MTWQLIAIVVVMGVIMYFLMIRPAKKQQKAQQDLMSSLQPGTRVMTGSGIYGTIRHLGEKQAVIEISPGVDLTVLRAAIRSVVPVDEEEFEYSDELSQLTDGLDSDLPAPDDIIGEQPPDHPDIDFTEPDMSSPFAPGPDSTETDGSGDQEK